MVHIDSTQSKGIGLHHSH